MFRQSPLGATERARRLFVPPQGFEALAAYAARGYNVLAVAERGGGKTSSLRQLQLILQEKTHPDDPVIAFLNLSPATSVDQALLLMINAARAANGLVP